MRIRVVGLGGAVLAFLVFASIALAQEPTGRVYGAPGADIDQDIVGQQGPSDVVTGALPFTGLDLALMTLGASFLLLLGWGLRRLGRAQA